MSKIIRFLLLKHYQIHYFIQQEGTCLSDQQKPGNKEHGAVRFKGTWSCRFFSLWLPYLAFVSQKHGPCNPSDYLALKWNNCAWQKFYKAKEFWKTKAFKNMSLNIKMQKATHLNLLFPFYMWQTWRGFSSGRYNAIQYATKEIIFTDKYMTDLHSSRDICVLLSPEGMKGKTSSCSVIPPINFIQKISLQFCLIFKHFKSEYYL